MTYLEILCLTLGVILYMLAKYTLKLQKERAKMLAELDAREVLIKRLFKKDFRLVESTLKEIIAERETQLGA